MHLFKYTQRTRMIFCFWWITFRESSNWIKCDMLGDCGSLIFYTFRILWQRCPISFEVKGTIKTRYLKELLTYLEPLYLFYCNVNKEQNTPLQNILLFAKATSTIHHRCQINVIIRIYTRAIPYMVEWDSCFFAAFAIWMHCYSPKIIYCIAKKRNCIFKWFCHFECTLWTDKI